MIRDQTRMTLFRLYLKLGLRLPAFLQHISVRTAYGFARRGYRPATPFEGELTLIRATSGTGNDEPYTDRYIDPLLGWSRRATGGVRDLRCSRWSFQHASGAERSGLAEYLQAYMDGVLETPRQAAARLGIPTAKSPPAPGRPKASCEPEARRQAAM